MIEKKSVEVVPPNQLLQQPNYLLQNPRACSLNHKRKIFQCTISCISQMLIPIQCLPPAAYGYANLQYFAYDFVVYDPHALQHSTRSCDLIFGDDASCILSSHSVAYDACLFLLWVNKHSSTAISTIVPLQHILLQNVLFFTFLSKTIKH